MKSFIYTIVSICLFTFSVKAQTEILFQNTKWDQVLAKAKAENKPIFIDVYTSWCGPCKMMAKNVFTQKSIADKFNSSFVNYKLDAEKGEGVSIASKYQVNAYPTYLFLNSDGSLIYRSIGSMTAEKFSSEADLAIQESKETKPLATWESEYEQQKNDLKFLQEYYKKRTKIRLSCANILDQIYKVGGIEAISNSNILNDLGNNTTLNTDGSFFQFLMSNREAIKDSIKVRYNRSFKMDAFLIQVAKDDVKRAASLHDEKLLAGILSIFSVLPTEDYTKEIIEYEAKMKYYDQTGNNKELLNVLTKYSSLLMTMDMSKINNKDSLAVVKFNSEVESGKRKYATDVLLNYNRKMVASAKISFAYKMRDAVNVYVNNIEDKSELSKATILIDKAVQLSDNFSILEAKAQLAYKMGQTQMGITIQEEAIATYQAMKSIINISSDKIQKRLTDTLEGMKAGKPVWESLSDTNRSVLKSDTGKKSN